MMQLRSLLAAVALSVVAAAPLHAQPAPPPPQPQQPAITVVGEARKSVAPDIAQIEAGVSNMAKTARGAAEANNLAMGKVLLELKNAGLDGKDIQTSRLSIQPQYASSNRPGPTEINGYLASNMVTVQVRDIARVANLIDTLVQAGANEIRGISFRVADPSKVLDDVRAEAVADARRKAEIYARAAGVTLGAPVVITEDAQPGVAPMRKMAMTQSASAPIAPGEEALSVTVLVSWAIKTP
ncbi:SIMPL domain-containing protein [Rhodopseudomonas sp. HC1]|uniref:SIMPL domain-containing protein n=1 Tax=Rhodopseudomonas infernalis TaxID=2897386 RepID=UPI001EE7B98A|nr:SIMPL domain-containing protein [Rhodopseudomonas infernalis]MCG6205727.1 SIMPL domain-containing protein [Rhodopseudomonas infernalis]